MGLSLSRGIIHVYDHNIQRSSCLNKLGQSNANFTGSDVILNKLCHMTKMAAISIYGKSLQKTSLQELLNLLQQKLICSN